MSFNKPQTFSTDNDFDHPSAKVSNDEMDLIMDNTIVPCVDVLLVDRSTKEVIMPKRISKPAEGLWFVGGRIPRNADSIEAAAAAVVLRETGSVIDQSDLEFVAVNHFKWDYRKFDANGKGRVDINFCYAYEPTTEDITAMTANLTEDEYDVPHGFKRYNRESLQAALANEPAMKAFILDYYDQIFGK